jgi:hypothetical protein
VNTVIAACARVGVAVQPSAILFITGVLTGIYTRRIPPRSCFRTVASQLPSGATTGGFKAPRIRAQSSPPAPARFLPFTGQLNQGRNGVARRRKKETSEFDTVDGRFTAALHPNVVSSVFFFLSIARKVRVLWSPLYSRHTRSGCHTKPDVVLLEDARLVHSVQKHRLNTRTSVLAKRGPIDKWR